ncbi:hypothetical protein [Thiohalorhabdus sp.]|uniref:hypothetical protein n=1 Tax=Thiohalorhabdus sp. TaxID=3094134 RepID=UPI002FC2C4CB
MLAVQWDLGFQVVDAVLAGGAVAIVGLELVRRGSQCGHAVAAGIGYHRVSPVFLLSNQVQGVPDPGQVLGGQLRGHGVGQQPIGFAGAYLKKLGVARADPAHAVPDQGAEGYPSMAAMATMNQLDRRDRRMAMSFSRTAELSGRGWAVAG